MNWNTSSGLEIGLVVGLVMVFYSPVVWVGLVYFIDLVMASISNRDFNKSLINWLSVKPSLVAYFFEALYKSFGSRISNLEWYICFFIV